MGIYRNQLPQMSGNIFLTDGGLETTLIFNHEIDLPEFAAFVLLDTKEGQQILYDYYATYAEIARQNNVGFILEGMTWRANPDWAKKIGFNRDQLACFNQKAIQLLEELRTKYETKDSPFVISGTIGPRGDGYDPSHMMTSRQAQRYHSEQINIFRDTSADMISALTLNYIEEAVGITKAAQDAGLPVVISFTVETDGHLPTGHSLKEAINTVDTLTNQGPAYYMINCAHPTHFDHILPDYEEDWMQRIMGLRANSSTKSHEELDNSEELDDGNPQELGQHYKMLKNKLKNLTIHGGCCGTDHRHVTEICRAVL